MWISNLKPENSRATRRNNTQKSEWDEVTKVRAETNEIEATTTTKIVKNQ